MENIRKKNPGELSVQLSRAELFLGGKTPESVRADVLSLSVDELKKRYPKQYQAYASFLKTEATLLNFPDIEAKKGKEKPKINVFSTRTRGYGFKVTFPDTARIIKPMESSIETGVAQRASDLGIGPKQFKSKGKYIHEEFIEGTPFLRIEREKCTPEYMEKLGKRFFKALKRLHENNILVNDQILADDFGNCHVIIDEKGEVRFIDFGASVDLSDFPDLPNEAVVSLMRTDPFMAFRIRSVSEEEQKAEIKNYREHILSQFKTKEEIIEFKDIQLLQEGLYFLQNYLPNVEYFAKGVRGGM